MTPATPPAALGTKAAHSGWPLAERKDTTMNEIDELMAAISDIAGVVQTQGIQITALDGELATCLRLLAESRDRLTLLEKGWE